MNKVITITTDLGDQFATSQLRAVMASLGFDGQVIENHSVTPFSISEGAFEIKQIATFSPSGTFHVGIVDPGVGSERLGIVIQTKRSWFIGPNNGLLYPAASGEEIKNVWRLQEYVFGGRVTNTFHGRDIFIKAAVLLAEGRNPSEFNSIKVVKTTLEKISFVEGEVVHIDAYGNYKICWPYKLVVGKQLIVKDQKNGRFIIPIVKTFSNVLPNKPVAFLGSHGLLEIAINLGSAKRFFQFSLGEKLTIQQSTL